MLEKLNNYVKSKIDHNRRSLLVDFTKKKLATSSGARLFLGDSVFRRVSNVDSDKRSLSEMIEKHSNNNVALAYQALNSHHFSYIMAYAECVNNHIETVCIPINMRSFSPQWCMNPEWLYAKQLNYIRDHVTNKLLKSNLSHIGMYQMRARDFYGMEFLTFNSSYPISCREIIRIIQSKANKNVGSIDRWRAIFEFHYLPIIQQENRILNSFRALLNICNIIGCRPVLYYLPINYEFGNHLYSGRFADWVQINKKIISDTLLSSNLLSSPIHDFSYDFGSDMFFRPEEPTEHLNENGRLLLTEKLTSI